MQIPGVEDVVTGEDDPDKNLQELSEHYRFAAAGSLAYLGTRYSSVELQHKAWEWRGA